MVSFKLANECEAWDKKKKSWSPRQESRSSFSSPEPRSFWSAAGIESSGFVQHRSPRFTNFPSNLANLIGWEYETNTLHMLRKSGPARALDPCCRSEGSWFWGRECEVMGSIPVGDSSLPHARVILTNSPSHDTKSLQIFLLILEHVMFAMWCWVTCGMV